VSTAFLVVSAFTALVSAFTALVSAGFAAAVSELVEEEVELLQAANAPIAKTNRSFFIVIIFCF